MVHNSWGCTFCLLCLTSKPSPDHDKVASLYCINVLILTPDLFQIMSSRGPDLKPDRSFYDSVNDKDYVSRFRIHIKSSKASKTSRSQKSTHWTFEAVPRRPRHGHIRLDPAMKTRHNNAVSDFCEQLTAKRYSTDTRPDDLSYSIIDMSKQFASAPTEIEPSC